MKTAFNNGGYLSGEELLAIILRKCKDDIEERMMGRNSLDYPDLLEIYREYLRNTITGLTPSEREEISKEKEYGIISDILELTDWGFEIHTREYEDEARFYVKRKESPRIFFSFMAFPKEEAVRIIRSYMICSEGKELTVRNPVYEGNGICARRPPEGDWYISVSERKLYE